MLVDGMNYAKGHITTENGVISVEYKKTSTAVTFWVEADAGINAVFSFNGVEREIVRGVNVFEEVLV